MERMGKGKGQISTVGGGVSVACVFLGVYVCLKGDWGRVTERAIV